MQNIYMIKFEAGLNTIGNVQRASVRLQYCGGLCEVAMRCENLGIVPYHVSTVCREEADELVKNGALWGLEGVFHNPDYDRAVDVLEQIEEAAKRIAGMLPNNRSKAWYERFTGGEAGSASDLDNVAKVLNHIAENLQ